MSSPEHKSGPEKKPAPPKVVVAGAGFIYRMRRRIATGMVVAAALFFGYHAFFGENGVNMYSQKRAEGRAIEKRIADLQQQNARLAAAGQRTQIRSRRH